MFGTLMLAYGNLGAKFGAQGLGKNTALILTFNLGLVEVG